MMNVYPLHFRPTIVICLGQDGMKAGDQLALLLEALDPVCRPAVALLGVSGGADAGGQLLAGWYEPGRRGVAGLTAIEPVEFEGTVPLATLIVHTLRGLGSRSGVVANTVIEAIRDEHYTVPDSTVTVWIVGAANSPLLSGTCAEVQLALTSERVLHSTVLLALLNIYPAPPAERAAQAAVCANQPWRSLLQGENGQRASAAYAYFFETTDERGADWRPDASDVDFAAAEAIFALTATPIVATHQYQTTLQRALPHLIAQPYELMNGVGTSRLVFPRAHAEAYCADRLAADVIAVWGAAQADQAAGQGASTAAEDGPEAVAAERWLHRLRTRMANSNKLIAALRGRAGAAGLGADTTQFSPRPLDKRLIFDLFESDLDDLVNGGKDLADALDEQSAKANQGLAQWKQRIKRWWEPLAVEAKREVSRKTNELLLSGSSGNAKAFRYVDALNRLLRREKTKLATRKKDLEAKHTAKFNDYQESARGPWLDEAEPAPASANGAESGGIGYVDAQGTPFARPPESEPREDDAPGQGQIPPEATEAGQVRAWEQRIIDQLAQRYHYYHREVSRPTRGSLAGAAAAVVPPAALVVESLLPDAWSSYPLSLPASFVLVALVAWLASWVYVAQQERELRKAAKDLKEAHIKWMRYKVRKHENERREGLLVDVHGRVRQMHLRLEQWSLFVGGISTGLRAEADQIERLLLEGAIGRRDILVANARRLRPDDYTLKDFYRDVLNRIARDPKEPWHASAHQILPHLRERLEDISLVDDSERVILLRIRTFCSELTRAYLNGSLVSLDDALEAMRDSHRQLFDDLLERGRILVQPADAQPAPLVFVACRNPHRGALAANPQAQAAIQTEVTAPEWLAVVRLWPHGAMPSFAIPQGAPPTNPLGSRPTWSATQPPP